MYEDSLIVKHEEETLQLQLEFDEMQKDLENENPADHYWIDLYLEPI